MHMADALLSPTVGLAASGIAVAAVGYSAYKVKADELSEKKVPIMAVAGAFVFAAQMINFTIPGTGSSGHIGGGILLACLLGGFPAMLSLSAVLIIQCLFFADGGLLALGCNVVNLAVIPCLVVYPLLVKPILKRGVTATRLTVASVVGVVVALQLGSLLVVTETSLSKIALLPFNTFILFMQPIHLAIGAIEGVITASILVFVHRMRPDIIDGTLPSGSASDGMTIKRLSVILLVVTLVVAGGLSLFASQNPDGLEWSIERVVGGELLSEQEQPKKSEQVQEKTAIMPDYGYKNSEGGTSVAGLIGSGITLALAGVTGVLLTKRRKKRDR